MWPALATATVSALLLVVCFSVALGEQDAILEKLDDVATPQSQNFIRRYIKVNDEEKPIIEHAKTRSYDIQAPTPREFTLAMATNVQGETLYEELPNFDGVSESLDILRMPAAEIARNPSRSATRTSDGESQKGSNGYMYEPRGMACNPASQPCFQPAMRPFSQTASQLAS